MHRFLIRSIAVTGLSLASFGAGAAETIRQWQFAPQGDTLELALREVEARTPARNEVAVRVRAVSLNRRDLMMVAGRYGRGGTQPNSVPLSDGAGDAVASVRGRRWLDPRHLSHGGQHRCELREVLIVQPAWWLAREMAVEGVDQEREWEIALELASAPGEHQVTAFLRSRRELREQARFADSRLSAQPDGA